MASGFGAESGGIGPFTSRLNNLSFACRGTYALRVLALPQKTASALPKDIHHSPPVLSFSNYCESSSHIADLPTSCLPRIRPERAPFPDLIPNAAMQIAQ